MAQPTPLLRAYRILRTRNGHLNWWPGRTRLEIMVGAILTQNTTWTNVTHAIRALKSAGLLCLKGLREVDAVRLEAAIRPAGYFRQKARKLKALVAYLDQEHGGRLRRMERVDTARLRAQLLGVWGIGPETADSILLYAFQRPVFVVDSYTRRMVTRHGWLAGDLNYETLQALFTARLPRDSDLYNDFHAQIVWVGKHFCRTKPRCGDCPLAPLLPAAAQGGIKPRA